MALKIESRFSPSIVRAAQITKAVVALASVPFDSPLRQKASSSLINLARDLTRVSKQIAGTAITRGYETQTCLNEMKADRHRKALAARARREKAQLEREALLYA